LPTRQFLYTDLSIAIR